MAKKKVAKKKVAKKKKLVVAKPDVAVLQAENGDDLEDQVNEVLSQWKKIGFIAAPVSVVVAPQQPPTGADPNCLTAILSPDVSTNPPAWRFGISTNSSDWVRGKLFRNNAKSQSGVVVFNNVIYYWGTTY